MKKIYSCLMALAFLSCSVEDDGLIQKENYLQNLSAVVEIAGCETYSYNFEDAGVIKVINDEELLYVSIVANEGYELTSVRLQVEDDLDDFPFAGNGNLPPGQMEIDETFPPGTSHRTFEFPLFDFSGSVTIASLSSFSGAAGNISSWAGDHPVQSGNWAYFVYTIQECEHPCAGFDAGPNNSKTISLSEANTFTGVDQVRNLYLSLLAPGVYRNGTFNPSIWTLITDFKENGVGTYITTYTITEENCSDSVELIMIVEPD